MSLATGLAVPPVAALPAPLAAVAAVESATPVDAAQRAKNDVAITGGSEAGYASAPEDNPKDTKRAE